MCVLRLYACRSRTLPFNELRVSSSSGRLWAGMAYCAVRWENEDMLGLLGQLGNHLHAAGAGADHTDALVGDLDSPRGPAGSVVLRARERVGAPDPRLVDLGKTASSGHQVMGGDRRAPRGADDPPVPALVEAGLLDTGVELDVATQVEAVSDVVEVPLQLGLGGVPLAPVPLLLELLGKRVAVVPALHVAPGPGIAVPVPRPPDTSTLLEHPHRQAEPAQPVQRVQPGRAGADDHHVEVAMRAHPRQPSESIIGPMLVSGSQRSPTSSSRWARRRDRSSSPAISWPEARSGQPQARPCSSRNSTVMAAHLSGISNGRKCVVSGMKS